MAHDKELVERIRTALQHLPVEEKKMFGSLAFMVNGKMCLTVGSDEMMCRIDPNLHDQEVARAGCRTVTMGGRQYKGYISVSKENLVAASEFDHWLHLSLDFNQQFLSR